MSEFFSLIFLLCYLPPRLCLVAYLGRCVGNARFLCGIKGPASVTAERQPWVCPRSRDVTRQLVYHIMLVVACRTHVYGLFGVKTALQV